MGKVLLPDQRLLLIVGRRGPKCEGPDNEADVVGGYQVQRMLDEDYKAATYKKNRAQGAAIALLSDERPPGTGEVDH